MYPNNVAWLVFLLTETRADPCGAVVWRAQQPSLIRAQSDGGQPKQKKMIRRHSSGDHAFLPSRADRKAISASQKSFGVPDSLPQDRVGDRLPTTRGY